MSGGEVGLVVVVLVEGEGHGEVRGVEPDDGVDVVGRHALLLFRPPLLRKVPGLLHSPHQKNGG